MLSLACPAVFAQPYNSRNGFFQVNQKKGCAPFTVTIVSVPVGECNVTKPCTMTWGDNTPNQQNTFTHTYTIPGTYTLSIQPQSISADDIVITVDQNIQPAFEIYACSGSRAAIKVTDNNYDQYVIDFTNDGTPEYILPFSNNIQTPSFTYAPPGTYTAAVRGRDLNSADNCTAKTEPFTTLATLPTPTLNTLTAVDPANITLDFTTAVNIQYRLEVALNNASTFQVFKVLYGVNTLAISDLKLDENYYCFRLGAYDPCTNSSTYSNILCTNRLTVVAQSDVIDVTSNMAAVGIVSYSITRNGNPYVNVGASPFNDTDVECKTDYCYRVTANYGGGATSVSLEKCATAFSNLIPTAIDNVTATVADNGATLAWTQDPLFVPVNYAVSRSSVGSPFSFYTNTTAAPYSDAVYTTSGKYCYKINYVDKCDNASGPGSAVCPVQLTGTLAQNNVVSLVWSGYRGWKNGVKHYILEKYDLQGGLIQAVTQTDTTFTDSAPDPDNQYLRYVVRAIPNEVAMGEGNSNELVFIRNANLYYPTAFTPNSDNLNDGFVVQGQYIVKIRMSIFDRWGVLLYSSDKNEPWDGTSNGKPMPASSYIWKVDITDKAGRTFSEEGTVALFR